MSNNQLGDRILQELQNRGGIWGPNSKGYYTAFCPFHDDRRERRPNLNVNPERGNFRCHKCKEYGNLRRLAEQLGVITVSQKNNKQKNSQKKNKQKKQQLPRLSAQEAMDKLRRERYLADETIRYFQIRADERRQGWEYPIAAGVSKYKAFLSTNPTKYWYDPGGVSDQLYNLEGAKEKLNIASIVAELCDDEFKPSRSALWLVNGEPAVWACHQADVPAICNLAGERSFPKGAEQQIKELNPALVIIVPDLDDTGWPGAKERWWKLKDVVPTEIRLLPDRLGEGADVADLFAECRGDADKFQEALDSLEVFDTSDWEIPTIETSGRHLRHITADALQALYKANDPPSIFVRSGELVRVKIDENQRPIIETINESILRSYLARKCNFVETVYNTKAGPVKKPQSPPLSVVRDILSLGDWEFPPLIGVTEIPIVRPDGSILTEPGYDAQTRLYYHPSPNLTLPQIPQEPTDEQVKDAINLVLEPLVDFPFDSQASVANAVATMLTPILRPMIKGPVPMSLFDKPQPGTGSSLLAEVISVIATGKQGAMMPAQEDDEEWRKAILSLLLRGQTVVIIDNVEGVLSASSLETVLTSTTFEGRILGKSETISLPNRATWIMTGNNIRLYGSLPRRCIWSRLNAQMARPWQRDSKNFRHPQLIKWVLDNRGDLLAAILTIVRGWAASGMPKPTNPKRLGGYENYAEILGGILEYMGIQGFLENLNEMYDETDKETPQWEAFLQAWVEAIGSKPVTAAELANTINHNSTLRNALPDVISDPAEKQYIRKLGNTLAKYKDMQFPSGYSITKAGELKRAAQWRVEKVSLSDEDSPNLGSKVSLVSPFSPNARNRNNDENEKDNRYVKREWGTQDSPDSPLGSKMGESRPQDSPRHAENEAQHKGKRSLLDELPPEEEL